MRWFEHTVRLILVISVIMALSFYNFDFKIALIVLSLVYFFQSIILYPVLRGSILRYIIYLIDFGFIVYMTYITDQIYLSLFWFLLISNIASKLEMLTLLVPSVVITGFSFYRSGFYDFNLVFLSIASLVVISNFLVEKEKIEKKLNGFVELSKNLYRDNLVCNDQKEFYQRYYNITQAVRNLISGGLKSEIFCETLFDNLNCDAVFVMDLQTGWFCSKGMFTADETTLTLLSNDDIDSAKRLLGVKFIILKDLGNYRVVLIYKDYVLIDRQLIEVIS